MLSSKVTFVLLLGYICHTCFTSGYPEFGPALPYSAIYQKLKPLRTGIERTFGLVKENRYRMEQTNFYKGLDNVTIHAVEYDIVLFLSWHVFESTAEH